jgi:hypothetical protein
MRSAASLVGGLLGLLDEGDDVAHAEDAPGDAVGVEGLERVGALADADELDRLAGDGAHREGRTAAAVAVHPGQDDAGEADAGVEVLRGVDGVLAGEAVDDEEGLARLGRVADGLDLGHQLVVDREAAGGVEEDDVVAAERRLLLGALGDGDGVLAGDDGQGVDADLRAEDGELLHRGRAARVERGHQDALALALLQALGELGRGRRLARALEADHQDRRGRVVDAERGRVLVLAGEDADELVMDDLDDLLARRDRAGDGLAAAFSPTAFTKSRATGRETSASRSATRTSRSAFAMSSSVSAPCLVRRPKTPERRSERFSNMGRDPSRLRGNAPVGATR